MTRPNVDVIDLAVARGRGRRASACDATRDERSEAFRVTAVGRDCGGLRNIGSAATADRRSSRGAVALPYATGYGISIRFD